MGPLNWLKPTALNRFFWFNLLLTGLVIVAINAMSEPLVDAQFAPLGIVSFELAGSAGALQMLLSQWSDVQLSWLKLGLGFDYLFMLSYGVTLAAGCVLVGQKLPRLQAFANGLAWLQFVAALCDASENAALIWATFQTPNEAAARIAYYCAACKFSLTALGSLFILLGGAVVLFGRKRPD